MLKNIKDLVYFVLGDPNGNLGNVIACPPFAETSFNRHVVTLAR